MVFYLQFKVALKGKGHILMTNLPENECPRCFVTE